MVQCKRYYHQLHLLQDLCKFVNLFVLSVCISKHLSPTHLTYTALYPRHLYSFYRTPGFVASFVLRTPEQVEASSDNRELNPIALYCPILTALILVGLAYQRMKVHRKAQEESEREGLVGEGTPLISRDGRFYSEAGMIQRERLSTELNRRHSVTIMGIAAGETYEERVERKSVADISAKILEEDEDLSNLDF